MKGLEESHCTSGSHGAHCTADYVAPREFLSSPPPAFIFSNPCQDLLLHEAKSVSHLRIPPSGQINARGDFMYTRKQYFKKHALIMLCCCGRSGIDYSVKTLTLDNAQVAMQLWDTAGQER